MLGNNNFSNNDPNRMDNASLNRSDLNKPHHGPIHGGEAAVPHHGMAHNTQGTGTTGNMGYTNPGTTGNNLNNNHNTFNTATSDVTSGAARPHHGPLHHGETGQAHHGLMHLFDKDRVNPDGTGAQPYGTTAATTTTGIGSQQYGNTGVGQNQYGATTGTTGLGTQPGYGTNQYGTTGTQQGYGPGTTGFGTTGVKTMNTVESVTRDAQAQIDAQAEEAIRKSRELNAQDHARLQASIREATASLEEQARQLKLQIDQEKAIAAQHVQATQHQKLQETARVQQMEEQKILEAAAARKIELEQKAMRLQQEIDTIVRQKTEEMMREKPGNLVFTHQHQDTTVGAQLAGDIGHVLDLKNSGRVTEATMQGNVQYTPVQVQQQPINTVTPQVQSQVQTTQGPEVHEKHGGFFHALKTAITGHHTTDTTGKQQQAMAGNRAYDQQSTWAQDADKHVPQQQAR